MQNLTVQKVCLFLITVVFFIAAPWITSEVLGGNTLPLIALGGVAVTLLFVYGLGDRCWWIIPFCLSIDGCLNFLPLNFSMQELAVLTVFCYLLLRMIFGMDVPWKLGPAILWVPLSGVLAVVLYHWIISGDIGIKMLGGSGWGGRKYFKVFIAFLCIPLLASFPGMRWQDLQKVPLIYFLGSFVDIVPDLLTTFIPASAPLVWRVYSGVNLAEYGDTLRGNFAGEKGITRFGALAKLGSALGLVTLCYFHPRTWLRPSRLWVLPVLLIGGLFCALSGFRNTIFRYGVAFMAGLYATVRSRSLMILPLAAAAVAAIAFTQGKAFEYPMQIQRALSFLPGEWNPRATAEGKASNEWRQKIDEVFYKEYFQQAPLFGQGYHFDARLAKQETDIYLAIIERQAAPGDEYHDVRRFIEMRQPHQGVVHILLAVGVVGSVFFVLYCFALLIYSFGSVLRTPSEEVTPIQVWTVAILSPQIFGFFIVYGDLTYFLIQVCPVAALVCRLERIKSLEAFSQSASPAAHPDLIEPELVWRTDGARLYSRQPPVS